MTTWCATVRCMTGVALACTQSSMNWGSSSGQSSYHARGQNGESAAVLPKGRGSCPVTEIGSKATGRDLAALLGRGMAVERLASSTLGGELSLALPLPLRLIRGGPSSDGLDGHWLTSKSAGIGSGGLLLSLARLAGGGPPATRPPTDTLVVDRSGGGGLSAFLFVDDEEDLVVTFAKSNNFISRRMTFSSMQMSLSSTCSQ